MYSTIFNLIRRYWYHLICFIRKRKKSKINFHWKSFLFWLAFYIILMFCNETILKQSSVKKMVCLTRSCNVTVTECLLSSWNIAGIRETARERERDGEYDTWKRVKSRDWLSHARNDPLVVISSDKKEFCVSYTRTKTRWLRHI